MTKRNLEDDKQSIIIKRSRSKTFLAIVIFFLFLLLGALFIHDSQGYTSPMFRNPSVLFVIGIAGVSFSGAFILYGLYKITDPVGLRLDSEGIYDNSNASSAGLIRWKDITGIRTEKFRSQNMLIISVSNDDEYINNASNFIVKQLLKINKELYGSPTIIMSTVLKIDFDSLKRLVIRNWKKYK